MNITKRSRNNNYKHVSFDYIAGLMHADGTFTVNVIAGNKKMWLCPSLILTQSVENRDMIDLIKESLGDLGSIKVQANKVLKYRINSLEEIVTKVVPLFDEHQVRGNRYYSYLKFKLLSNILYHEKVEYKSPLWMFCFILKTVISPGVPVTKDLHRLTKNEKNLILNKQMPEDLDHQSLVNKYCPELTGVNLFDREAIIPNTNPITKDFINGIFDGDGSLTVGIKARKLANEEVSFNTYITFEIIQDAFNGLVLEEIKEFFNCKGKIVPHKTQKSISYFVYGKRDLISTLIPKMLNIPESDLERVSWDPLTGPPIKLYKFYNYIQIYRLTLLTEYNLNDPVIFDKVLGYIYNIISNPRNLSFSEFNKLINKKWKEEV